MYKIIYQIRTKNIYMKMAWIDIITWICSQTRDVGLPNGEGRSWWWITVDNGNVTRVISCCRKRPRNCCCGMLKIRACWFICRTGIDIKLRGFFVCKDLGEICVITTSFHQASCSCAWALSSVGALDKYNIIPDFFPNKLGFLYH